jgi:hypothetical protein
MMRKSNLQFFGRDSLQLNDPTLKIDPRPGGIPAGEKVVYGGCRKM